MAVFITKCPWCFRGDLRKAAEKAAELMAQGVEHRSGEHIAEAAVMLAVTRMDSGAFDRAAESFDRGIALLESMAKPEKGWLNRIQSAWNLWFLGYPDRALQRVSIASRTPARCSTS